MCQAGGCSLLYLCSIYIYICVYRHRYTIYINLCLCITNVSEEVVLVVYVRLSQQVPGRSVLCLLVFKHTKCNLSSFQAEIRRSQICMQCVVGNFSFTSMPVPFNGQMTSLCSSLLQSGPSPATTTNTTCCAHCEMSL